MNKTFDSKDLFYALVTVICMVHMAMYNCEDDILKGRFSAQVMYSTCFWLVYTMKTNGLIPYNMHMQQTAEPSLKVSV